MKRQHSKSNDHSLTDHMINKDSKHNFTYKCKSCPFSTHTILEYSVHCQVYHNNNCRYIAEQLLSPSNVESNDGNEIVEEVDEDSPTPKRSRRSRIDNTVYRIKSWNFKVGNEDLHTTLENLKEKVKESLVSFIQENISIPSVKFGLTVIVEFAKLSNSTDNEDREREWSTVKVYFNSKLKIVLDANLNFSEAYDQSVIEIWENCDKFIQNGSGYVFRKIQQVKMSVFRYQPYVGANHYQSKNQ